jgi:hypothetical protein
MEKPMRYPTLPLAAALALACHGIAAFAAVSAEEAARLKSDLTPLGAERAGNKDGTIPAWTGGLTTPTPGFKNGGRRPDPFADEKPLLQITAKNAAQHADRLTDGTKALLKRYPDSFRLDVYRTHRTAAAPQWMYDNTLRNATQATLVDGPAGPSPKGALGGVPFPIPKSGMEAIWNGMLRWRGESWFHSSNGYQITADGKVIVVQQGRVDNLAPYYQKDMTPEKFSGEYWLVRAANVGPPIRAGEAILGRLNINEDRSGSWVYLTGQRRVRKLPHACCDTPTPFSAGVVSFDEIEGVSNRQDRFDWKIVGKKELYVPYNSNRTMVPTKDADVVGPKHLNPDHVRWELHRTWVLEATLKPGQRHTSPRSRFYLDEDSWNVLLVDRWDANGQLWRMPFTIPVVLPDLPGVVTMAWGTYELLSGGYYVNSIVNEQQTHYKLVVPRYSDAAFSPDALAGEGVR